MNRLQNRLFVLLIALALFALGGCSSGGRDPSAASPSPTASAALSPAATTNPFAATASASPSALPSASPATGQFVPQAACEPKIMISQNRGEPGGDYIRAAPRNTTRWSGPCDSLEPGDQCSVAWDGIYSVKAGDAYIQFQAWAEGQDKPFRFRTVGPIPGQNEFRDVRFGVTIPKTTKVAFRLLLGEEHKVPVAIGDTYFYPVNCDTRNRRP